jgi:hypothetical protein
MDAWLLGVVGVVIAALAWAAGDVALSELVVVPFYLGAATVVLVCSGVARTLQRARRALTDGACEYPLPPLQGPGEVAALRPGRLRRLRREVASYGFFMLVLGVLAGVVAAIGTLVSEWSLLDGAIAGLLSSAAILLIASLESLVTWAGLAGLERRHGARVEIHEEGGQRLLRRAAAMPPTRDRPPAHV